MSSENFWIGTINLLVMAGFFIGFGLWSGRPTRKQGTKNDSIR